MVVEATWSHGESEGMNAPRRGSTTVTTFTAEGMVPYPGEARHRSGRASGSASRPLPPN